MRGWRHRRVRILAMAGILTAPAPALAVLADTADSTATPPVVLYFGAGLTGTGNADALVGPGTLEPNRPTAQLDRVWVARADVGGADDPVGTPRWSWGHANGFETDTTRVRVVWWASVPTGTYPLPLQWAARLWVDGTNVATVTTPVLPLAPSAPGTAPQRLTAEFGAQTLAGDTLSVTLAPRLPAGAEAWVHYGSGTHPSQLQIIPSGPDTEAPAGVEGVQAVAEGPERVRLGWQPGTDNVVVERYRIYRGIGAAPLAPVWSTDETSFLDAAAGPLRYAVAAIDAAGNEGPQSAVAAVTVVPTSGDNQLTDPYHHMRLDGPAQVTGALSATYTGRVSRVGLQLAQPGAPVTIYRDGTPVAQVRADATGAYGALVQFRNAGGDQWLRAVAWEGHPVLEASSTLMPVRVVVPPSAPLNVRADPWPNGNGLITAWDAPADAGGTIITYYHVERAPGSTSAWSALATVAGGLPSLLNRIEPETNYSYRVRAQNIAGIGPWSDVLDARSAPQPAADSLVMHLIDAWICWVEPGYTPTERCGRPANATTFHYTNFDEVVSVESARFEGRMMKDNLGLGWAEITVSFSYAGPGGSGGSGTMTLDTDQDGRFSLELGRAFGTIVSSPEQSCVTLHVTPQYKSDRSGIPWTSGTGPIVLCNAASNPY